MPSERGTEDAMHGCPRDPVSLCDLAQALALLAFPEDGSLIELKWPASDVPAFEPGPGAYRPGPAR